MTMFFNTAKSKDKKTFLVSKNCHPQTIDVLKTRSEPLDIVLVIQDEKELVFDGTDLVCYYNILIQMVTFVITQN